MARDLLWSRHVIEDYLWKRKYEFPLDKAHADATEQLEKIANRPEWWAHAYVAVIIAGNAELATDAIRDKLTADKNEVVRGLLEKPADRSPPK